MHKHTLHQKEINAAFISKLVEVKQSAIVVARLNIPGEDKRPPWAAPIFKTCIEAVESEFKKNNWPLERVEHILKDNYFEHLAIFCVTGQALMIKEIMVQIEETHDFGRVFDLDVIDETGEHIDRTSVLMEPRKCYLCNETAYGCVRSKAHQTSELIEFLISKAKTLLDKSNNWGKEEENEI